MPRDKALADMKIILAAMERATGHRPMIYAPRVFYSDVLDGALTDYPLWVRGLGRALPEEYGTRTWTVRQHSENGAVPGITGDVDLDCAEAMP